MDNLVRGLGSLGAYDGKSDPKDFVRQFNLQSCMFDWNDDKKAAVIPYFLEGKADRIYKALTNDQKKDIKVVLESIEKGSCLTLLWRYRIC